MRLLCATTKCDCCNSGRERVIFWIRLSLSLFLFGAPVELSLTLSQSPLSVTIYLREPPLYHGDSLGDEREACGLAGRAAGSLFDREWRELPLAKLQGERCLFLRPLSL